MLRPDSFADMELSHLVLADPLAGSRVLGPDAETQALVAPDVKLSEENVHLESWDPPSLIPTVLQHNECSDEHFKAGAVGRIAQHSSQSSLHSSRNVSPRKSEWQETLPEKTRIQLNNIEAEEDMAILWYKDPQVDLPSTSLYHDAICKIVNECVALPARSKTFGPGHE